MNFFPAINWLFNFIGAYPALTLKMNSMRTCKLKLQHISVPPILLPFQLSSLKFWLPVQLHTVFQLFQILSPTDFQLQHFIYLFIFRYFSFFCPFYLFFLPHLHSSHTQTHTAASSLPQPSTMGRINSECWHLPHAFGCQLRAQSNVSETRYSLFFPFPTRPS